MIVQDVYVLVTLMGLCLPEVSSHQKAYKELLAYIDNGHTLTKVQHEIISDLVPTSTCFCSYPHQ